MPSAATPLLYVECDVPAGQTLVEWRRTQRPRRATRRLRIARLRGRRAR